MIGQTYNASGRETLGGFLNKIEVVACCMEIPGYKYPTNLMIAQCQATIRNCGISKMELQKLDAKQEAKDNDLAGKRKFLKRKRHSQQTSSRKESQAHKHRGTCTRQS